MLAGMPVCVPKQAAIELTAETGITDLFHDCETGVPGYTGYTFIGSVSGLNTTTFIHDNNGAGLIHGVEIVTWSVACYPDGAESYASVEVCTDLVKDIPVITHVSIITTDLTTGSDFSME